MHKVISLLFSYSTGMNCIDIHPNCCIFYFFTNYKESLDKTEK